MDFADGQESDLDFVIDVDQEWQCRWWAYGFRVAPEDIRAAVLAVGSSASAVRRHLMSGAGARGS